MEKAASLVDAFQRHRVAGLIHVAEYHQKTALPAISDGTPAVLANCFDDRGTSAILPDDRRSQNDLVERLITAWHRLIGYLTLRPEIAADPLRRDGYRLALAEAGIVHDPALMENCDLEGPEGTTQLLWGAIDRMLRLANPTTVFYCGNDKMALKIYGVLQHMGRKVPVEVSVAGDDSYRVIADTLYPPLTTVDLPWTAMGVRAAQRLLAMISGEVREDKVPTLVVGPVYWRDPVHRTAAGERIQIEIRQGGVADETPELVRGDHWTDRLGQHRPSH